VTTQAAIHILDDDLSVRRSVERQLRACGWPVRTYATVQEFAASNASMHPGCLLLDLRMPDASGLDVLQRLESERSPLAVVIISGFGDVPTTVRAMRLGAIDFLTKPLSDERLVAAVSAAVASSLASVDVLSRDRESVHRMRQLTPRQREVCELVATGLLNKQIAAQLGISIKTVKVHRARVMSSLQVASVADLVRLVDRAHTTVA
jgi:FixJ family two-component response regulator